MIEPKQILIVNLLAILILCDLYLHHIFYLFKWRIREHDYAAIMLMLVRTRKTVQFSNRCKHFLRRRYKRLIPSTTNMRWLNWKLTSREDCSKEFGLALLIMLLDHISLTNELALLLRYSLQIDAVST